MSLDGYLRKRGLNIREVSGWENRGRPYKFEPEGVMVHHTAGTNSLKICTEGRSGLPGPLCHFLIHKNGTIYLIADGYANGSGKGSSKVLADVRANRAPSGTAYKRGLVDDTYGNRYFWNIEVENLGNGKDPYPQAQIDALAGLCKALCDRHGWSTNRIIHHKEWTRRKVDMSYSGDVRRNAARWSPVIDCETKTLRRGDSGPCVVHLRDKLRALGIDVARHDNFGSTFEGVIKRFQRSRGLSPDGVVGTNTWAELDKKFDYHVAVTYKNPFYAGMGLVLAANRNWPLVHDDSNKTIRIAIAIDDSSPRAFDVRRLKSSSDRGTAREIIEHLK